MWKKYSIKITAYQCVGCHNRCKPYIEEVLRRVGIVGRYTCNYSTLYKTKDWNSLLRRNTANVVVMKKEYVREILLKGLSYAADHPKYVDTIYHLPLPQGYIDLESSYRSKDITITVFILPEV